MKNETRFLRYGETTASRTGGYCGTLDPDLTPEGCQMAEDFAEAYKSLAWTAIFSSPLRRATATTRPLCEAVGIQMALKEGLKEVAYGQWEGKTPEAVNREFHDEYVRWLADPGWNAPPGGERGIDIARCSSLVLQEIEQTDLSERSAPDKHHINRFFIPVIRFMPIIMNC